MPCSCRYCRKRGLAPHTLNPGEHRYGWHMPKTPTVGRKGRQFKAAPAAPLPLDTRAFLLDYKNVVGWSRMERQCQVSHMSASRALRGLPVSAMVREAMVALHLALDAMEDVDAIGRVAS